MHSLLLGIELFRRRAASWSTIHVRRASREAKLDYKRHTIVRNMNSLHELEFVRVIVFLVYLLE